MTDLEPYLKMNVLDVHDTLEAELKFVDTLIRTNEAVQIQKGTQKINYVIKISFAALFVLSCLAAVTQGLFIITIVCCCFAILLKIATARNVTEEDESESMKSSLVVALEKISDQYCQLGRKFHQLIEDDILIMLSDDSIVQDLYCIVFNQVFILDEYDLNLPSRVFDTERAKLLNSWPPSSDIFSEVILSSTDRQERLRALDIWPHDYLAVPNPIVDPNGIIRRPSLIEKKMTNIRNFLSNLRSFTKAGCQHFMDIFRKPGALLNEFKNFLTALSGNRGTAGFRCALGQLAGAAVIGLGVYGGLFLGAIFGSPLLLAGLPVLGILLGVSLLGLSTYLSNLMPQSANIVENIVNICTLVSSALLKFRLFLERNRCTLFKGGLKILGLLSGLLGIFMIVFSYCPLAFSQIGFAISQVSLVILLITIMSHKAIISNAIRNILSDIPFLNTTLEHLSEGKITEALISFKKFRRGLEKLRGEIPVTFSIFCFYMSLESLKEFLTLLVNVSSQIVDLGNHLMRQSQVTSIPSIRTRIVTTLKNMENLKYLLKNLQKVAQSYRIYRACVKNPLFWVAVLSVCELFLVALWMSIFFLLSMNLISKVSLVFIVWSTSSFVFWLYFDKMFVLAIAKIEKTVSLVEGIKFSVNDYLETFANTEKD